MSEPGSLIRYVGSADLHDGHIQAVERGDERIVVTAQGYSGTEFILEFYGVSEVQENHPVGMMLYALAEMSALPGLKRFVFLNWDDEDDRKLEITAREFRVLQGEIGGLSFRWH